VTSREETADCDRSRKAVAPSRGEVSANVAWKGRTTGPQGLVGPSSPTADQQQTAGVG